MRWAVATLQALPVGVVLASALALAWHRNGSIAAGDWLPYAALATLLLATALLAGAASVPPRLVQVAVVALLGLALWAAVSATWSPLPTLARDEALLVGFYAVAVALAAATLRSAEARLAALLLAALALGGMAVASAAVLRFGGSPLDHLYDGRVSFPITYANAQAALAAAGFWPGIVLAARRASHPLVRAVGLGAAGACLGATVLPQSKGALLGLAASAAVVLACSPARLRVLVPAMLPVAGTAAAFPWLTAPFRTEGDEAAAAAVRGAGAAVLVLAAAAAVTGLVYAYVDRAVEPSERARRVAGRAAAAALVVALAGGAAAFVVRVGDPVSYARDGWSSFARLPDRETGATHLQTLGSNRYDFWRVAVGAFADDPVAGIGARGFGAEYLLDRRSIEQPARSHSLLLDVLAEQGVVGFALLATALGGLVGGAFLAVRRRRAAALAGLGAGTAWLVQASVDWTWTVPAATLPVLLLLAAGVAGDAPPTPRRPAVAAAGVAAALALLVFVPPWLSWRIADRALAAGDSSRLEWARRLDPVSTHPLVVEARLAPTAEEALEPLRTASRKEPRSYLIRYATGVAELAAGNVEAARSHLRAALRLKPGDAGISAALRRAR